MALDRTSSGDQTSRPVGEIRTVANSLLEEYAATGLPFLWVYLTVSRGGRDHACRDGRSWDGR